MLDLLGPLLYRADNDLWALPGGGHEVGESIEDAVVREVREETGMDVAVTGLVGLYTNPAYVMAYDDGEVRQRFSLCFRTRLLGGQLASSPESRPSVGRHLLAYYGIDPSHHNVVTS